MEKKSLLLLIGLMSLISLSSCDDKLIYDDENHFVPILYSAKMIEGEEVVSTTLQIKGLHNLVFDEIEKTDWKIITPAEFYVRGHEPLAISQELIPVTDGLMWIQSNYGDIPVTIGNSKVTYEYMGETMELDPQGGLNLMIHLTVKSCSEDRPFLQYGTIDFALLVGYLPVKIHSINFIVADENGMGNGTGEIPKDNEGNESDK